VTLPNRDGAKILRCPDLFKRAVSRYRQFNIVYDRAPDLFAAHVWIAMISIISRRIVAQTQPQ
jgi:hypothetical protein